jgi:phage baseplate assembly protein W
MPNRIATQAPQAVPQREQNIAFPYSVTEIGRTSTVAYTEHVRELVRQVLFTTPGERVNQPLFGCDLRQLVFDNRRNELAIAIETMVQASLQRWLGDIIQVQTVSIQLEDNAVSVDLRYLENRTQKTYLVRYLS